MEDNFNQSVTNPNTYRTDQTMRRDGIMPNGFEYINEFGVENTPAGCSVIYSYKPVEEGITNYNIALQICNMNDNTKPLPLAAIDQLMFPNRIEDTPNDKYCFVSVKKLKNGNKCYRYVYLNNDMTADTTREVIFKGDFDYDTAESPISAESGDTNVDHLAILNGE